MPTTQKTLMFLSGFLTSLGSVVVICSILGTQAWVTSTIFFTDAISNGTIVITYGLFRGMSTQDLSEGLQELDKNFEAPFVFLTMVLFVGNTESNHLSEELSHKLYTDITIKTTTHSYGYSFWLVLLVILLNIVTVVIIIFYQKARYQQKQEQRKPVEYAPRDGILF
ncbi:hypothetical protein ACRRTK_011103 [Alexandromys fortis]